MSRLRRKHSAGPGFAVFLRYLEQQYISLRSVGAAEPVLKYSSELLDYLKSVPETELEAIFPSFKITAQKMGSDAGLEPDEVIGRWPIERVEELLGLDDPPRGTLERVARLRFGLSRGAVSSLKNKTMLKEKISTLVRNERGHDSIRRLAQSDTSLRKEGK